MSCLLMQMFNAKQSVSVQCIRDRSGEPDRDGATQRGRRCKRYDLAALGANSGLCHGTDRANRSREPRMSSQIPTGVRTNRMTTLSQ
jgi:hypothetical protein